MTYVEIRIPESYLAALSVIWNLINLAMHAACGIRAYGWAKRTASCYKPFCRGGKVWSSWPWHGMCQELRVLELCSCLCSENNYCLLSSYCVLSVY